MFRGGAALAAAGGLVSGCVALPPPPVEQGVSEASIVRALRCEIRQISAGRTPLGKALQNYAFQAELELKLVDSNNAGANAVLVFPQAPETISANFGVNRLGSSTRKSALTVQMDPRKLDNSACASPGTGLPGAPDSLGIADWARTTFGSVEAVRGTALSEATYFLEFILTTNANGGVTVVAYRIPGATLGGGVARQYTHTLTLVATARKPDVEPDPIKVSIIGWPSAPGAVPPAISAVEPRRGAPRRSTPAPAPSVRELFSPETSDRLDLLIQRERTKRIIIER